MKKLFAIITALSIGAAACGPSAGDRQATVAAAVAGTVAAQPAQQVTVPVPVTVEVQVPVQVPATVIVEVTSIPPPTQAAATEAPSAKATAAPAATSAPAVSNSPQDPLAGANLTPIIAEDFIVPDYWYEFDTSAGSGKITSEGTFVLTSKLTEHLEWSFNGRKSSNFYMTAKTVLPDQKCKAGDHWGLIFRYKDNANFYFFGVSCDGKYKLSKRVDGLFETLVDLTDSSAILKLGQKNVVGVRAVGDRISLYANDQFLTTITDNSFADGLIGMYVASRLTPDLTVVFDDLTLYAVNQ